MPSSQVDCNMALLKSICKGNDVINKVIQATILNGDKRIAFRHDSTPTSTDLPRACQMSNSARVGELSTCEKKLDDARTALDTPLMMRGRIVLILAGVDPPQSDVWSRKVLRTAAPRLVSGSP